MRKMTSGSNGSSGGEKHKSKCRRYVKAPIRNVFHKAKQFYVKNMVDLGNRAGFGGPVGCPAAVQISRLPRSLSFNNFSTTPAPRGAGGPVLPREEEKENGKDMAEPPPVGLRGMWRCHSLGLGLGRIGTIDEDRPCHFEDEFWYAKSNPRTRSTRGGYVVWDI